MSTETRISICPHCTALNRIPLDIPQGKSPKCGKCGKSFDGSTHTHEATDQSIHKIIASSPVPVIVDCWAPWCGPCKAFSPTFQQFAEKHAGKVLCIKLNTEEQQSSAGQLGIRSIPTIIAYSDGKEINRKSGAMNLPMLEAWLQQSNIL